MKIGLCLVALAGLASPDAALAQRADDRAQFDNRMAGLQRSLATLSAQIEQLKARDQQLQQQLDKMQADYGRRLDRLERPAPKAAPSKRRRR